MMYRSDWAVQSGASLPYSRQELNCGAASHYAIEPASLRSARFPVGHPSCRFESGLFRSVWLLSLSISVTMVAKPAREELFSIR